MQNGPATLKPKIHHEYGHVRYIFDDIFLIVNTISKDESRFCLVEKIMEKDLRRRNI